MIAGKPYRCIECVRMVARVDSSHVCAACRKSQATAVRKAHDKIVARIGSDRW